MNCLRPVTAKILRSFLASAAAILVVGAVSSHAEDAPAHPEAGPEGGKDSITLELNKLEPSDKGCKAYVVASNLTTTSYDALRLDLVMFQTDGVIGRRFALELAPLRPSRRTVKMFELDGTKCDGIGSFLINDVMECKSEAGPVADCLSRIKVNSLTKVELSK
jgi:hypothetical protein